MPYLKNFKVELFLTLIKTVFVAKVKFILFALLCQLGQGHHNSICQLLSALLTNPSTLSIFPVGGNRSTRRKLTTFGSALTFALLT
jgi:hypothetical protein